MLSFHTSLKQTLRKGKTNVATLWHLTSTPNRSVRLNLRAEVLSDSNEQKTGWVPAVIWIALLSEFESGTVQATA
jgi:hypothetical protein